MVASDAGIAWLVREAMDGRGRIKFRKLSRNRMSRAAVSATKLKQCVRKQPAKIRKCMCLPSNYALVEFPVVWSELRSVSFSALYVSAPYSLAYSAIGCFNYVGALSGMAPHRNELCVDEDGFRVKLKLEERSNEDGFRSCQQVIGPANQYLKEQEARQGSGEIDLKNPLSKPRIPYEILFAIGGWSAGSPTNFVETYDTRADRWFLSVNTDVTPRSYHGLCTLNNLIYMIGGFDGNQHFNTVRCFDPVTREWRERACMYHARCYVSVCTHGGKIYALGGYNGRTRLSSGERYEPQRNQWEMIPPMHRQRSDASAAALQDKIYIVGGFSGREVLNSAEVFDVETNQWSYIHPMIDPRSGVCLVAFRDSLYALGGFNGFIRLSSGERYNPNHSEDWHAVPEMFSPRSNFATVILDDMIFVVGGFNGSTTIAYAECYDPDSNEWYDASPMNLNRSALSACVIAGLANAREYSYHGKARDLGQGQASSENQQKSTQGGEGAAETNASISTEEGVNFNEQVPREVSSMNEIAENVGNYLG
ncbi:Kelch-like protein 10 [Eufriesea mexicana]|uniref:Kelch-like protein 10 n=1 Tax=Eufriesea mexicana TaxID=516756 RepID=A0A310SG64_9HYME|nr:Kelch-like protein 10 [Eufriesea mexicana]